jgi:hypothetical protein
MRTCPECRSDRIHRSKARTIWKAWRKRLTRSVPFRCRQCGWRGWRGWRGWTDAALDFIDHHSIGSSSLQGSHLLRAGELNKVSPDDIERLDPAPAMPSKRDGVVISS